MGLRLRKKGYGVWKNKVEYLKRWREWYNREYEMKETNLNLNWVIILFLFLFFLFPFLSFSFLFFFIFLIFFYYFPFFSIFFYFFHFFFFSKITYHIFHNGSIPNFMHVLPSKIEIIPCSSTLNIFKKDRDFFFF